MNTEDQILTVDEFCDRYRIHPATFYRQSKRGKMPLAFKVGGATRILARDEQAWLAKQIAQGAAQ